MSFSLLTLNISVAGLHQKLTRITWKNWKMLRLISFSFVVLSLAVFSGCKMCASYTDITGSPVPNAMSSDYHRAGSQFGGYSSGGYADGYQTTAIPQHDYNSEFSRSPQTTQNIPTLPYSSMRSTSNENGSNIVPAVINSQYVNY